MNGDAMSRVSLPPRAAPDSHGLLGALSRRRSGGPSGVPLSRADVATLLGWGCGTSRVVMAYGRDEHLLRTAPMPGGIDALRVWVLPRLVEEIDYGVYAHEPRRGDLLHVADAGAAQRVIASASQAPALSKRAAVLVVGASLAEGRLKYGTQFDDNALLGCGGALQSLHLVATMLGIEACSYTGFVRTEAAQALGVGDDVIVAALFAVG